VKAGSKQVEIHPVDRPAVAYLNVTNRGFGNQLFDRLFHRSPNN
jgi:hypothetical protein